jgi:hypothetical protein
MWRMYIREHETIGPWVRKVEGQPSWVTKAALTATVLVVAVPVVLLTLAAIVVGVAVFALLGLAAMGIGAVRQIFAGPHVPSEPMDDGRRNVRVMRR